VLAKSLSYVNFKEENYGPVISINIIVQQLYLYINQLLIPQHIHICKYVISGLILSCQKQPEYNLEFPISVNDETHFLKQGKLEYLR